jgi:hypothetical protein
VSHRVLADRGHTRGDDVWGPPVNALNCGWSCRISRAETVEGRGDADTRYNDEERVKEHIKVQKTTWELISSKD